MEIVEVFYNKLLTVDRDRDDEILVFDLVFVGQNNTDFNVTFCYAGCFQEFNSCTYINFELPSSWQLKMGYVSYYKNTLFYVEITEAVVRRCSLKKVFLEISQNSQESTCPRVSFLIKLQVWPATLLKKNLWHSHLCILRNF